MLSGAVYGPLDRVRRVSRVMQGMIVIGAAMLLLILLWAWFGPLGVTEKDVLAGAGHAKAEVLMRLAFPVEDATMTDQVQRIALIVQTLPLVLVLYALYQAYQLFAGYRCGEVLTIRAADRLRHISYAMLAVAVTVPLLAAALSLALTWNSGKWHLALPLSGSDYFAAALAGLLLALAHVLTEAAKIARENSEIV
jgi:hypothetical protein